MKKIDMNVGQFARFMMILLVGSWLWSSCHHDYLIYDKENKDGIFYFGVESDSSMVPGTGKAEWCLGEIRVDILGFVADRDRSFKVSVVDSLTTIPATEYRIDSCYIPANESYGLISIHFSRNEERRNLGLMLEENENFRPVMNRQVRFVLIGSELSEPSWWTYSGGIFGTWSPRMEELLVEFYKKIEESEPYVWSTFFFPYMGAELDNVYSNVYSTWWGGRWNSPYKELMTKYVIRPWYDYMEAHPEEGENTIPNPYN